MPSYRHHDFGNLYIKFDIVFPTSEWAQTAGEATLTTLRQVLPPPAPLELPADAHVDDSVLATVDPTQQRRAQMGTSGARANGEMDLDDDEEGPRGVQCASQ